MTTHQPTTLTSASHFASSEIHQEDNIIDDDDDDEEEDDGEEEEEDDRDESEVTDDKDEGFDLELHSLARERDIEDTTSLCGLTCVNWHIPHVGLTMAVISSLFFSLCSLIVHSVGTVSPLEHSTMRFVGVLLPSVTLVIYSRENPTGRKGSRLILFFRGVLGSAGLMFQFYAFQHMPLADASVLIFSSPVFVAISARIFLKEPCGVTQIVTIMVTLVGVILIARPPFLFGDGVSGDFHGYSTENLLGAVSALCGTVCSANVYILIRKLKSLHYAVIMMTFAMVGIVMSHSASLAFGALCLPCSFKERLYLLLLGIFSFCGQVLLTKALQYEQAGPVSICRTADIVFAFIWQVAFLGEIPNVYSVIGATMVTLSVLVMGVRKWLLEMPPQSFLRKTLWFLTV